MSVDYAAPELIRVKERYQVTIPSSVRKQMNITEGDYMEVRFINGEIRIKPRTEIVGAISGADWYRDYLAKLPDNPLAEALTDQDINRMVKESR